MMMIIYWLIGLVFGAALSWSIMKIVRKKQQEKLDANVNEILEKAKKEASDIKYNSRKEAKNFIKNEKMNFDKEIKKAEEKINERNRGIDKKEVALEQKIEEKEKEIVLYKQKQADFETHKEKLQGEKEKLLGLQDDYAKKLAMAAGMTKDEAKKELVQGLINEAKVDAAKEIRRVEEEMKEEAEKKAKRVVGIAIQRFAGEYVAERTITSVELPSDDVKGRLIGREGRNIRAFEQICGVDLIIDDTPEVVVISCFNVVRREVARLTIEKLIADGRIHPAKIEEFHDKSRVELDTRLRELGEKAQMEIGVHGIHPEVLKLVGALNYRTSYTQNQYQHALEAAFICGAMASELGLNVKQARRAGLLHDIGKVIDASAEGSHAVIGAEFAKKYGESADIVHAIRAHHDDEKPASVLAHLVASADALSGARPGARKAMMESYVSRLTDIEEIVNSFEGVSKSYALSAGREVRVLVENDKVSDEQAVMLSRDISKRIESEMSYPGQIKITVIRETRAVGIAR